MSLPDPRPGLVICYSYVWAGEHAIGVDEGRKTRPCAIVALQHTVRTPPIVTVVPMTHSPPASPTDAIEIPAALKAHLGLDGLPSWIVVTETNDFLWPGVDLHPVSRRKPIRYDFGMLPPRFFAHLRDRILRGRLDRRLSRIPRSDR